MTDDRLPPSETADTSTRIETEETSMTNATGAGVTVVAARSSDRRPPIRWGGVVWGLILIGLMSATVFVVSAPGRIQAVHLWLSHLHAGAAWALLLAVVGVIIVVLALLAAIRSAQRRQEHAGRA